MTQETLGQRLKSVRKARQITLARAGHACGCDGSNISHAEGDRQRPNIDMLRALAALYGCSIDELTAVGAPLPTVPEALVERDTERDAIAPVVAEGASGSGAV